jgi:hypothetical protein
MDFELAKQMLQSKDIGDELRSEVIADRRRVQQHSSLAK